MTDEPEQDYQRLSGVSVRLDDIVYMPSLDAPPEKPHPFIYFLTIDNASSEQITLTGRKWIVRESDGEVAVVEGEGIVGKKPVIAAGESFSYNSYHVTACDAEVTGAFFGVTGVGQAIKVLVPKFRLVLPEWA